MIEQRLQELGIVLPEPTPPLYQYIPVVIHNGTAYISGQVPRINNELLYTGKVGAEVSVEEARKCAEICVLKGLSCLRAEIGSLDYVERVVKVGGFVQSNPGFSSQPQVIDAASELLERIFGENGRHARTAVGVAELPTNAPVEIDLIVAVRSRE
ncbi:RidA family protein [Bacillus sp. 165]|uniref:RidA family protein n=1 Tax=Bacillus sp. 165 TaxID=1529117 RepID=UPI001ADBFB21|nr:RidA family protein [Bacillus sp. 165]MBO9128396.1 RidA family protein [Bacillus sp. 165]